MIRITYLNYKYDNESPVLKNINLEIPKTDYTAIIGPNGCGKTTLIRHINGLLLPSQGDVWVDGKNTKDPISVRVPHKQVFLALWLHFSANCRKGGEAGKRTTEQNTE